MFRHLFGRIAALWRTAAVLPGGNRAGTATAKDTRTMDAHQPAGRIGPAAGDKGPPRARGGRASAAPDDLLARAMSALGADFRDVSMRESLLVGQMRPVCRSCAARSRCRRDLGTGDFTRRYRHYCPLAEDLARLAAGSRRDGTATLPQPRA